MMPRLTKVERDKETFWGCCFAPVGGAAAAAAAAAALEARGGLSSKK